MKSILTLLGALVIASAIAVASSATVYASERTQDVANCTTAVKTGNGWQWFCCGDCEISLKESMTKRGWNSNVSLMLMGGGYEVSDSLGCLKNFLKRQKRPIITVLRSHGDDEYNPAFYSYGTAKSVSTFVITSRAGASDEFVNQWMRQSTLVFFSGGDQGEYWRYWVDTPLQASWNELIMNGGFDHENNPFAIGGTSAGLAIMGEYMFAALNDTVESPQALADPYNPLMTMAKNLVSVDLMKGVITDTHFRQRDRMGRMLAFMARSMKDNNLQSMRGYAANERSCADVFGDGTGFMDTNIHDDLSALYFFQVYSSPDDVIAPGKPLTLGNPVQVMKIAEGQPFDFVRWNFVPQNQGVSYALIVKGGKISVKGNGGSVY